MTMKNSVFETVVDNEALFVLDIRLPEGVTGPVKVAHDNSLLVGVEDGSGALVQEDGTRPRFLPIARGRVDWLGRGQLDVKQGRGAFGRALLVEVRKLPRAEDLPRIFGDRVLDERDGVCVYEEIIGPSQVRAMHHHGPRLVICLSDIDLRNTLPGGETLEVKRKAGAVTWNAAVVTHEVLNVAPEPFWCICIEHP
jgi:hypothetical protein